MTPRQAISFVRKHGIVLESAQGSVPSLAQAIAGKPLRGNWWAHPRSHRIFAVTRAVRECSDILVCRLVDGRVTFVHRELWPALVRVAHRFPHQRLAQIHERHTTRGHHVVDEVPFPDWVPPQVSLSAESLSEDQALEQLALIEQKS